MTLDDALLAFYRLTERNEGLPPTLREFSDECHLASGSPAFYWFRKLEEADLIYTPGALLAEGSRSPRTVQLTKAGLQRAYLLLEAVA